MAASTSGHPLPGYPHCGRIQIDYFVHGGIQGPEHPNPGDGVYSV